MWRDTNAIRDIEPETDTVVYNWGAFWKEMNQTRGVHCTTRKISARRAVAIKCIINRLPTMEKLNKRKPEIYEVAECQVCESGDKETQDHLASCSSQKLLWKRIQKVSTAKAWQELKEEEKIKILPPILYTAVFRETEEEEVENRKALIRGLSRVKTREKLEQLLD